MNYRLLQETYEKLADVTPLKTDCGKRCNSACCHSSGCMLLFPGERELLTGKGFAISSSMLESYGPIDTLKCTGSCERIWRPLACRIFPLAPKVINDHIHVRMDARGRPVCELTHMSLQSLSRPFVYAVKESLMLLSKDEDYAKYIEALSRRVDAFASFDLI